MRIIKEAALAFLVAAGCGHATTTGSAQNDWTTPTGYASATHPRVVDPDSAAHPARDRASFARREAPTLQQTPALPPPDTMDRDFDTVPPDVTPLRP